MSLLSKQYRKEIQRHSDEAASHIESGGYPIAALHFEEAARLLRKLWLLESEKPKEKEAK